VVGVRAEEVPRPQLSGLAARAVPDVALGSGIRLEEGAAAEDAGTLRTALGTYRVLAEDDGADGDARALVLWRASTCRGEEGRPAPGPG
jgi:hypothetical protein